MKILMLENSLTTANDMPSMLAQMTGADITVQARGGARLKEHTNPKAKMGAETIRLLRAEKWDYVVLQEMSKAPAVSLERFLESARLLCAMIKENGAAAVFYATWAYEEGSEVLLKTGMSYDEMYEKMHEGYLKAAEENGALIADVCRAFYEKPEGLYGKDGVHPSMEGSRRAAEILANVMKG